MDLAFLSQAVVPVVLGICLIVVDIIYQMLIKNSTGSTLETLKETWHSVASGGKNE